MRGALFTLAAGSVLIAGFPAQACRFASPPAPIPTPTFGDRVVFTAVIEERWESGPGFGAYLKVTHRLHGEVGDRVDATWSRLIWPNRSSDAVSAPDEIDEVVIMSCANRSWYDERLKLAPMGGEVVVLARRTDDGDGVDVLDLAEMGTYHSRDLLALANP